MVGGNALPDPEERMGAVAWDYNDQASTSLRKSKKRSGRNQNKANPIYSQSPSTLGGYLSDGGDDGTGDMFAEPDIATHTNTPVRSLGGLGKMHLSSSSLLTENNPYGEWDFNEHIDQQNVAGIAATISSLPQRKRSGVLAAVAVGYRCSVTGFECNGTIRFVGAHATEGTPRVGVELDQPIGKHNGKSKGHVYFNCAKKHGVLVKHTKVKPPWMKGPPPPTAPGGSGAATDSEFGGVTAALNGHGRGGGGGGAAMKGPGRRSTGGYVEVVDDGHGMDSTTGYIEAVQDGDGGDLDSSYQQQQSNGWDAEAGYLGIDGAPQDDDEAAGYVEAVGDDDNEAGGALDHTYAQQQQQQATAQGRNWNGKEGYAEVQGGDGEFGAATAAVQALMSDGRSAAPPGQGAGPSLVDRRNDSTHDAVDTYDFVGDSDLSAGDESDPYTDDDETGEQVLKPGRATPQKKVMRKKVSANSVDQFQGFDAADTGGGGSAGAGAGAGAGVDGTESATNEAYRVVAESAAPLRLDGGEDGSSSDGGEV